MRDAVITLADDVFFFLIAFVSEGGKAFASIKKIGIFTFWRR
jgi:hypothetical protein